MRAIWLSSLLLVLVLVAPSCSKRSDAPADAKSDAVSTSDGELADLDAEPGGADLADLSTEDDASDGLGEQSDAVDVDYNSPIPPVTTLRRTRVGVVAIQKGTDETKPEWGKTLEGPGEPFVPRDDLKASTVADPTPSGAPTSLSYFVQVTDMQIIDEESPMRDMNFDAVITATWRPQEMWSLHMFEMVVRTVNRFCYHYRPFDFLLLTGDNINNNQTNEQMWFLGVLEGKLIDPDSGADDDPVPGPDNDANDPFQPEGLYPGLPWFTVFGNHDGLINGVISAVFPNGALGQVFSDLAAADDGCSNCFDFSLTPAQQQLALENDDRYKTAIGNWSRAVITPTADAPKISQIRQKEGPIPSDFERRPMTRNTWLKTLFGTNTVPDGHGFTQQNIDDDTAHWSRIPNATLPIRVIALNTTANSVADGSSEGSIDRKQLEEFLIPELKKAQDEKNLVIVTAHHYISSITNPDTFGPKDPKDVSAAELEAVLFEYPNVILWVGAHSHRHKITAHVAPSDKEPMHGFWELETSAVIDWPNQSRIIEVIDNRDGTGTIITTVFDYISDESDWVSKQADRGRFWAVYDIQSGRDFPNSYGVESDRNTLLRFAIPPQVRERLEASYVDGTVDVRPIVSYRFLSWPEK
ncbi:MAG: metallophosphoesterase [Myxococcales bacterium]|nr:metallophosphoesterase [Myxococcales bacterium]